MAKYIHWGPICVACLAAVGLATTVACGGSNPVEPSVTRVTLAAPTIDAPDGDVEVGSLRPELRVNNVSSAQSGTRTYEFQLTDRLSFFSGEGDDGSTPFNVFKPDVPEGAGGRTSYVLEQPLRAGTRYFWRARVVQGNVAGPWSEVARFRTQPNRAPVIRSLKASAERVEAGEEVTLTAEVEDAETPVENLMLTWSARAGTFTGTGLRAGWIAPRNVLTPDAYELTLTVVEPFTETGPSGGQEAREHRVSASITVRFNDSPREVRDLVLEFLRDFANSSVPAETAVRNFSDNCPGKSDEREEIRQNRATRTIVGSRIGEPVVGIDALRRSAEAEVSCEFTSIVRATGHQEQVRGTCIITAVYEPWRWWLCDSRFRPAGGTMVKAPFR